MAVRRMVAECIRAGLAGLRLDDQPVESKRTTQISGLEVAPLDLVCARYQAAVDMKNELDPDFVISALCYAREAVNGGMEECLHRLKAYEETGVDWVQMQAPHSAEEIKQGRAVVSGPFSFHNGNLPRIPSRKEHLELGVNIAWHAGFASTVTYMALWDFLKDFEERDVAAWEDLQQKHKDNPFRRGLKELRLSIPEGTEKQRELENRYFAK